MKSIIRLTEGELYGLISNSVRKILKEDNVLGDNWHEVDDNNVYNNYEQFEGEDDGLPWDKNEDFSPLLGQHDMSIQGEDGDPTYYGEDETDPEYVGGYMDDF